MEQTDAATRRTKRVAKPSMTGIRPYRTQSRRILTHPNTRHTTIRGTRSQQIKPVLLQQPFRMLRGNRKPLFQRERQTLVGIDQLARNIGLAIDVTGSRMRLDHQVKRAFRRFETILRKKTGNIARRHRGETSHAIDRRTRDQRFRGNQLARRHQQNLRAQIGILQRTDERARQSTERGGRHIGHIRIAQRHDTIQLLLRFF